MRYFIFYWSTLRIINGFTISTFYWTSVGVNIDSLHDRISLRDKSLDISEGTCSWVHWDEKTVLTWAGVLDWRKNSKPAWHQHLALSASLLWTAMWPTESQASPSWWTTPSINPSSLKFPVSGIVLPEEKQLIYYSPQIIWDLIFLICIFDKQKTKQNLQKPEAPAQEKKIKHTDSEFHVL